jgi:hypothetical protein
MRVKTQRLDFKTRFKVKGGFVLATVFLTLVDFLYWWLPRVIPLRRRQRPAGRLVFRVRE